MQGSIVQEAIHSQDYRAEIKQALAEAFPEADVYDPFERNKDSLFYSPEEGKKTFLGHNRMCGTEIDVLVAFVPEASMGTAIEIWEAWRNGALILTISPMASNLQMVFFRNNSGDVLVKILLNETEIAVDMPTDTFPYYRWSDLREYLMKL